MLDVHCCKSKVAELLPRWTRQHASGGVLSRQWLAANAAWVGGRPDKLLRYAKWDDSVALCPPAEIARRIHAAEGGQVDLRIEGDRLILTPIEPHAYTLDELLAGMTEENLHGEISTGRPVGNEV